MPQKTEPQRHSKPVRPTFFLQLAHRLRGTALGPLLPPSPLPSPAPSTAIALLLLLPTPPAAAAPAAAAATGVAEETADGTGDSLVAAVALVVAGEDTAASTTGLAAAPAPAAAAAGLAAADVAEGALACNAALLLLLDEEPPSRAIDGTAAGAAAAARATDKRMAVEQMSKRRLRLPRDHPTRPTNTQRNKASRTATRSATHKSSYLIHRKGRRAEQHLSRAPCGWQIFRTCALLTRADADGVRATQHARARLQKSCARHLRPSGCKVSRTKSDVETATPRHAQPLSDARCSASLSLLENGMARPPEHTTKLKVDHHQYLQHSRCSGASHKKLLPGHADAPGPRTGVEPCCFL